MNISVKYNISERTTTKFTNFDSITNYNNIVQLSICNNQLTYFPELPKYLYVFEYLNKKLIKKHQNNYIIKLL
jgi:hypothetical protein